MKQALRRVCTALAAGTIILAPAFASAQDSPQALRQEIDQLRKDFEALKQQYRRSLDGAREQAGDSRRRAGGRGACCRSDSCRSGSADSAAYCAGAAWR